MCGRLQPDRAHPDRSASSGVVEGAAVQAHGRILARAANPHRASAVSVAVAGCNAGVAADQGVTGIVSRPLLAVLPAPSRARANTLTVPRPSAGTGTFHSYGALPSLPRRVSVAPSTR